MSGCFIEHRCTSDYLLSQIIFTPQLIFTISPVNLVNKNLLFRFFSPTFCPDLKVACSSPV